MPLTQEQCQIGARVRLIDLVGFFTFGCPYKEGMEGVILEFYPDYSLKEPKKSETPVLLRLRHNLEPCTIADNKPAGAIAVNFDQGRRSGPLYIWRFELVMPPAPAKALALPRKRFMLSTGKTITNDLMLRSTSLAA